MGYRTQFSYGPEQGGKPDVGKLVCLSIFAACISQAAGASEQAVPYPAKTIRILVGYPPGGGTDILARVVANGLTEMLGQPVVVENRPGASAVLASELAARAAPDGYTLVMVTATHAINPATFRKLPFDPVRDFTPTAFAAAVPNVLLVHPSLPVRSVKELVAFARSRPGQLNYGGTGNSSPYRVAAEMFKLMTHTDIVHVPYRGAAPALTALLSGEISIMFGNVVSAVAYVKSGRIRALGLTGTARLAALPDLPTISEAGVPGYSFMSWFGVLGPSGIPRDRVQRLNQSISAVLSAPGVRDRLAGEGAEVQSMTPEAFGEFISRELAKMAQVVKAGGITPD
jgi:tripartite-type tricarboxylate transporter receptor subunit TctC